MELKQELISKENIMRTQILDAIKIFEADTGLTVKDVDLCSCGMQAVAITEAGPVKVGGSRKKHIDFEYSLESEE